MMCASLVGVLLAIEHLNKSKVRLDAFTGAHAESSNEDGISATVRREMPASPQDKSARNPADKAD